MCIRDSYGSSDGLYKQSENPLGPLSDVPLSELIAEGEKNTLRRSLELSLNRKYNGGRLDLLPVIIWHFLDDLFNEDDLKRFVLYLAYRTTAFLDADSESSDVSEAPEASEASDDSDDPEASDSCLLYTSPSPRDATLSRMPSSA